MPVHAERRPAQTHVGRGGSHASLRLRKFGEDEDRWGVVGLLHDFDYERWPQPPDHPLKGAEILAQQGYPDDVIYAIKSHADYLPDCPRVSLMDKTLYACDELAGFCMAVAMVRPEGLRGLQAKSVLKKMKQKAFAAAVSREDIQREPSSWAWTWLSTSKWSSTPWRAFPPNSVLPPARRYLKPFHGNGRAWRPVLRCGWRVALWPAAVDMLFPSGRTRTARARTCKLAGPG